jgi:hypothetical protein
LVSRFGSRNVRSPSGDANTARLRACSAQKSVVLDQLVQPLADVRDGAPIGSRRL